ncbi:septum formation inhibitor Maf [Pasteurellaceae bacterium HPA106]|uniref:Maf family protein n=1 Tax=Spirabiliibacterium pneumoniae TaxID=221400 RepID=UPI001AACD11F|nr:Maf family protein [Spirabiliibacterium pneumoniae]MBE2896012.1 septum formation inhibitor Maf [Spirabiliibacterium pneumoniae]
MPTTLYLASQSPRRWALLTQLGFTLKSLDSDIDETAQAGENAHDYVLRMAREKNRAARANLNGEPHFAIVTADTCVALDEQILGKPENTQHAFEMLRALSNRAHHVLTAVCVYFNGEERTIVQQSAVRFAALTETQIRAYIASGEPMDKAGACCIQGLGGSFVSHIDGSYTGIMGLPLFETRMLLAEFGILPPALQHE